MREAGLPGAIMFDDCVGEYIHSRARIRTTYLSLSYRIGTTSQLTMSNTPTQS